MTPAQRQVIWQLKKRIRRNGRKYPGPDWPGCGSVKVRRFSLWVRSRAWGYDCLCPYGIRRVSTRGCVVKAYLSLHNGCFLKLHWQQLSSYTIFPQIIVIPVMFNCFFLLWFIDFSRWGWRKVATLIEQFLVIQTMIFFMLLFCLTVIWIGFRLTKGSAESKSKYVVFHQRHDNGSE